MRNLLLMPIFISIAAFSCASKAEIPKIPMCKPYIYGTVYFEQGNSEIPSSQQEKIDYLLKLTSKVNTQDILIVGLSDSSEKEEESQHQLSIRRAKVVADYFVNNNPKLQSVIKFEGKGSEYPVSNDASKNRRSDIEIIFSPSCN